MNIAHFSLNKDLEFVEVQYSSRTIEAGGLINHAIVRDVDTLVEPQTGKIVEYSSVGYSYNFMEVFE
jgi:hypothetical protein